jgi:hypothetical protein
MLSLLADIWPCVAVAALLGVFAGWFLWGRDMKRVIATHRSRLAKVRGNWETVEERLTQALAHASALERERDSIHREWSASQLMMQEREDAWKQERRFLDETVRQLNQRLLVLESKPRTTTAAERSKRDLGQ